MYLEEGLLLLLVLVDELGNQGGAVMVPACVPAILQCLMKIPRLVFDLLFLLLHLIKKTYVELSIKVMYVLYLY